MDSKLEKSKKTLILLGTIFNIAAGCLLLTIIALMLFTAQQIFIDITTIATIVFFNLGLLCYLAALLVKVLFGREDKTNYEKLAFDKLITDYDNGNLPKDVWRVVEYYEKTKAQGHLSFFAGLEICELNETVETLIKVMPLDFSNNLYGAYEVFKGLNGISISVLSSQNDLFKAYDEFFVMFLYEFVEV